MKKLLLVLVTLTTLTAKGQTSVYYPFPDSAAVWREYGYDPGTCCCSGDPCLREEDYQYFLNGDTLIGTFIYKKVYKTGNGVEHVAFGPYTCAPSCGGNNDYFYYNNIYSGSIRQDTAQRTVFFVPPGYTQDTLLYDFNLNIGDTLPDSWLTAGYIFTVTAIDSILVGGFYHKRFELSSSNFPNEVTLIEGIGCSLGLLTFPFSNLNVSQFYNMLLCVTINGIPVYPDTATACNLASQINEVSDNLHFSIVPNPFTENLYISLSNYVPAEVALYDITSRRLLQQMFTSSVSLNTEQLSNGIYICEVRDENGFYRKEKVVKY